MRHFVLARTVAALALGMLETPGFGVLIAPRGGPLRLAPGRLRTLPTAIDIAPIAAPADHHLTSTPGTEE